MPITLYQAEPPSEAVALQIVELVKDNITALSMLSVPKANLTYEIYRWALPVEVGEYMARIGQIPQEPVEILVAFDEAITDEVVGFLLFSPVPTDPEACGINYMAVKTSHRRRGIGGVLMKELLARYPHAELTCTIRKVPFYESLGFQVIDSHHCQVVMNTRSESAKGLMAVLNVAPLYESREAYDIQRRLEQQWGESAMKKARKDLKRHIKELEQQVNAFARNRLRLLKNQGKS